MDRRIVVLGILVAAASCRKAPASCSSDGDCLRYGAICDRSAGVCRLTVSDAGGDGGGGGGSSGADGSAAVDMAPASCSSSSDCILQSAPICGEKDECRACDGPSDNSACAMRSALTPRCDGSTGQCAGCRPSMQAVDCAPGTPICNTDGSCRACQANSECSTGVCKPDGSCALPNEVEYVNNTNSSTVTCSDTAHTSTAAAPYCEIASAVAQPSPLPYVVVAGSATPYLVPLSWTSTSAAPAATITIIGPGHNAPARALLQPSTVSSAIAVTNVSGTTGTITIDGLEIVGQGSGYAGLKCSATGGTATVNLVNSFIHGSGGYGVDSASCALTLDADIVSQNSGGGVSINGGSVNASNNLIVGNGNAGPGVVFQGTVAGTWWFNTVADNTRTGTNAAAFNCTLATTAPVVQATIVWGNTKDGTGSSVGTGCMFSYADIDDATTPAGVGNFNMGPMLTAGTLPATGYRIPLASPCKDKITAASGLGGTLPTHDVDGNTRPRATTGGYDCGGSQAP